MHCVSHERVVSADVGLWAYNVTCVNCGSIQRTLIAVYIHTVSYILTGNVMQSLLLRTIPELD